MSWLLPVSAMSLAMLGCPGQELAPLSPCTVSAVTERVDQAGVSDVDLLFMIDNSGSMATKQEKLAQQLPRLLSVLTSGDRCADLDPADCKYDDTTTPKRNFTAVKGLHLGVITSNMGGVDNPPGNQPAIVSCRGLGDDGRLQDSTDIAVNGVTAGRNEFQGYAEGQTVIAAEPACENLSGVNRYQEYVAGPDAADALAQTQENFGCVSRVGVRGCPFEQQLEATWKALAPARAGDDYAFINDTQGQGDDYNEDFLREDAILAIVMVTDEDDCSITDAGKVMFVTGGAEGDAATQEYGALNLRCGFNVDRQDLIRDTGRYVRGLKGLKPDNEDRVIFAAITGVPQDAITRKLTLDEILELPEMEFKENPASIGFPLLSCANTTGTEVAYPPVRIVQVARDFGEQGIIYSVCEDDYAPALDLLIEKIANKLKGNCLPRKLNPDASGNVNCEVFELLPKSDESKCNAAYGHDMELGVVSRSVRENGKVDNRKACRMNQISIEINGATKTPKEGERGWYYDDFSPELVEECADFERQRITFRFADGTGDLRSGAGATFECFAPVARIDKDAKGFDAINTGCAETLSCDDKNEDNDPNGYKLICIEATKTCQIECDVNPDCPPGWVCAADADPSTKYCQLPTCPQSNTPPDT